MQAGVDARTLDATPMNMVKTSVIEVKARLSALTPAQGRRMRTE
jgi:hypothetical protein